MSVTSPEQEQSAATFCLIETRQVQGWTRFEADEYRGLTVLKKNHAPEIPWIQLVHSL